MANVANVPYQSFSANVQICTALYSNDFALTFFMPSCDPDVHTFINYCLFQTCLQCKPKAIVAIYLIYNLYTFLI